MLLWRDVKERVVKKVTSVVLSVTACITCSSKRLALNSTTILSSAERAAKRRAAMNQTNNRADVQLLAFWCLDVKVLDYVN